MGVSVPGTRRARLHRRNRAPACSRRKSARPGCKSARGSARRPEAPCSRNPACSRRKWGIPSAYRRHGMQGTARLARHARAVRRLHARAVRTQSSGRGARQWQRWQPRFESASRAAILGAAEAWRQHAAHHRLGQVGRRADEAMGRRRGRRGHRGGLRTALVHRARRGREGGGARASPGAIEPRRAATESRQTLGQPAHGFGGHPEAPCSRSPACSRRMSQCLACTGNGFAAVQARRRASSREHQSAARRCS